MLTRLEPIEVSSQKYPFPLAPRLWLYNECLCLSVVELVLELLYIGWQQPCFGEKGVIFRKVLFHCD